MKIGLVRRGYSPTGGAESYLRRLETGLTAAGHACVLFAGQEWPAAARPGAEFCAVGGRTPRAFADRLQALQPERRCDVLFSLERVWRCDCYRAGDGVHRAWLERRAAAEPGWRSRWRRWQPKHRQLLALEAALFGADGARRVIANSQLVAREIVEIYGGAPERVRVVYNGLPAAAFKPSAPGTGAEARAAWGLSADDLVILFAGSGWERKGLARAVAAVERLAGQPRPRLLVAGRGDARVYRHRERLVFLGPVREMAACYAAADVFVLPTLYDPFSNACLEALAAGLPVITTPANGVAEIIRAGEDGTVLPADADPVAALADALGTWSAEGLRARTRAGRLERAAEFTIERNVEQTLGVIAECVP